MSDDQDVTDTEEESYEDFTVTELKEELASRDLPTSGNKTELIERLEESDTSDPPVSDEDEEVALGRTEEEERNRQDDAAETSTDLMVQEAATEAPPVDPYKTTYSPYQLPADPVAAQRFIDEHPDDVDTSGPMPDETQTDAIAAIAERQQAHADMGTPVPDARVPGGDEPPPDPTLSSIFPVEAEVGPPANVLLTATGDNFTVDTKIGFGVFSQDEADAGLGNAGDPKWEETTFVNAQTLTTVITAGFFPGEDHAIPVVVGEPEGVVSESINFAFKAPVPPEEGEGEEKGEDS